MTLVGCWSKVPHELALCIFQNMIEGLSYHQQKQNLLNCQLVCKSWRKAAQKLIYSEIVLDRPHHFKFIQTLVNYPFVGPLVKKVKFKSSLGEFDMANCFIPFNLNCPNLEEIFAQGTFEKPELYSCLLLSARINNLKRIDDGIRNQQELPTYPFVAFKYRHTLTELYIDRDYRVGDYNSKETLIDQLEYFPCLQRIIITTFIDADRMDRILHTCSHTVHSLVLHCSQENGDWEAPDYARTAPISNIKNLAITGIARLGSGHLEYFKLRLNALENLKVVTANLLPELDEQYLDLVASIENYNISITIEDDARARNRIDRLIKYSMRDEALCKNREFELDFDYMPSFTSDQDTHRDGIYNWNLDLVRAKKSKTIILHYVRDHADDEPLGRYVFIKNITDWLHLYSPNVLRIYNVEPMVEHYQFLLEKQHLPEYSTVAFVRRYFAWLCKDKSWQLLDNAISVFNEKRGSVLSIGELILCDEPSVSELRMSRAAHISRVEIRKSIVHHKILPIISAKLSKLDTLMIDSSWILMDDDVHTLKILLPFTRVRRIGVVISPFDYGAGEQAGRTILDNENLLQATSKTGKYILKIESGSETFISKRQNNKSVVNLKNDVPTPNNTDYNFLIYIKCKQLDEFAIVGGLEEDVDWTPKFENVSTMR